MKSTHPSQKLHPREELTVLRSVMEVVTSGLELDQVLRRIVRIVSDLGKADSCMIYLVDIKSGKLVLRASKNPHPRILGAIRLNVGEGITGWVAKKKTPVSISRGAAKDPRFKFFHNLPEDAYEAFLSVPIFHKREVVGVINIQHRKPRIYSQKLINVLSLIARQVGGVIENARLFEETRKKALQIERLSKISDTVTQDFYIDEILNLILSVTMEMFSAKLCAIMLVNEKTQELELRATQGSGEEYKTKPHVNIQKSVSGRVVREGRPIAVFDVKHERGYLYPDVARKEGLTSLLSMPMRVKDKIIGVMNIYTSYEHIFSEDEVQLLDFISDQAAIAVEHTRLREEAERAKELLETRKLVERAKGILMKRERISEERAHRIITKKSMDSGLPLKEIAEAIILASEFER